MGRTQGLRKLITPANRATAIAGKRLASMRSIPNMTLQLGEAMRFVTGAWGHIPVDVLKHQGYLAPMSKDHVLDARGLLCPLPVLKARKRLEPLAPGDTLTVFTDDPAAVVDMPHFCNEAGHQLLEQDGTDKEMRWRILKS